MLYARVKIARDKIITFVSLLRSIEDNIIFDRTEKPTENIFELFIIDQAQEIIEYTLRLFLADNIIKNWAYYDIGRSSLYQYK